MPEAAPLLAVENLHAWYGESHILHGVSFTVQEGEVVTLLGRNGAGKTTTLRSIMGIVGRRTGSVRYEGRELIDRACDEIARAGIAAVANLGRDLIVPLIYGPKGDLMAREAARAGLKVVRKFFADRALEANGMLVSRKKPGSVISDPEECADRTLRMVREHKVRTVDGKDIDCFGQTVMVHGDTPTAVRVAQTIRNRLEAAGVKIAPMSELI